MNRPLLRLAPVFQEKIWGGARLQTVFHYPIPSNRTGRKSSGSSRKEKSKRTSTNLSFSDGIILIMKSEVPKMSALMMRFRLKYRPLGL